MLSSDDGLTVEVCAAVDTEFDLNSYELLCKECQGYVSVSRGCRASIDQFMQSQGISTGLCIFSCDFMLF